MNKRIAIAGAMVALTLTATWAAGGDHATGQDAEVRFERRSFTYTDREIDGAFRYVDVPPRTRLRDGVPERASAGDGLINSKLMFDDQRRRIGTTEQRCTITKGAASVARVRSVCDAVLRFPDGHLFASVSPDFAVDERIIAVTGGTGAYAGATGTIVGSDRDPLIRVELVVPR
jgi:hypothetical protein